MLVEPRGIEPLSHLSYGPKRGKLTVGRTGKSRAGDATDWRRLLHLLAATDRNHSFVCGLKTVYEITIICAPSALVTKGFSGRCGGRFSSIDKNSQC